MITILCTIITLASIAGVLWQLAKTNTDIRPQDTYLSEREALRFRLDNGLPIKAGHNGGPPLEDWADAETVEELRKA